MAIINNNMVSISNSNRFPLRGDGRGSLSSDKNTLELLALLRAHGITELVLCPGSRDAGIVHSALQIPEFNCHPITDERSAGFFAIGLALATGKPSAVIVTSGSALANLYPATCEAYYQKVPVIFISADRPARWIGQMDGQTMPQQYALGKMVKMSISIPGDNLWHTNRLINEAILECTHHGCGPVHINISIEEPIYDFSTSELPDVRVITRTDVNNIPHIRGRVLLLVGQMAPSDANNPHLQGPSRNVIAENLSNLPTSCYTNAYIVDWDNLGDIDILITLGGHLTCKPMKEHFRKNPPREHWHVSDDGVIADLFCCQTFAIESKTADFIAKLSNITPIDIPTKDVKSSPLLDNLFVNLPENANIHIANSTAVRISQLSTALLHDRDIASTLCNRGINGIEGSLSAAVGYAMATPDQPMFIIIGDLSFFYDQNALWNINLPQNLHILLINNGGGGIFDTLPIPDDPRSRTFIQAKHQISAKSVAEQYGLDYMQGTSQIPNFIAHKHSVILEIDSF